MGLSAHSNLLDPLDRSIQFQSHCLLVFKMQSANWRCDLICRHLWVVVYSWVRGWLLFCLRFRFLGNSVTCVFCPSGLKQRLDPRALTGAKLIGLTGVVFLNPEKGRRCRSEISRGNASLALSNVLKFMRAKTEMPGTWGHCSKQEKQSGCSSF